MNFGGIQILCHASNQLKPACSFSSDFFSLTWAFTSDALPEGLVRELPSADEPQRMVTPDAPLVSIDDLEDLRRQLDALNST